MSRPAIYRSARSIEYEISPSSIEIFFVESTLIISYSIRLLILTLIHPSYAMTTYIRFYYSITHVVIKSMPSLTIGFGQELIAGKMESETRTNIACLIYRGHDKKVVLKNWLPHF